MKNDMTLPQFEELVEEQIKARNGNLNKLLGGEFPEDEDPKLSEIFRYHTKIVTHKGDVIQGQDSENYWRELHKEGVRELRFDKKCFIAEELKKPEEYRGAEVNFFVIEITKFSFTVKGQEFFGYIDPINKHRRRCTQDP